MEVETAEECTLVVFEGGQDTHLPGINLITAKRILVGTHDGGFVWYETGLMVLVILLDVAELRLWVSGSPVT